MASEKELDQALECALRENPSFRVWFLRKTQSGSAFPNYVWSRSDYAWGKVRLILPNPVTGALEAVEREGETDVLVVLEGDSGRRLGLHIENKLGKGAFTPYQADVYAARADAWRGLEKYGNYQEWETVLVAPKAFYEGNLAEAAKFTSFVAHEELAEWLPEFSRRL